MKIISFVCDSFDFIKRRIYLILWISLVVFIFYDTFIYYKDGRQFYYLRQILGLGLCISRGTATVINLCFALVLLPICKKVNQLLYIVLSRLWPGLFFFWLERAKSFHMTVAITLLIFAVVHSISHCVNLWNFSRGYDEQHEDINFATYRNENPLRLLLSTAGVTGVIMLIITICMGLTSMRVVRRRFYNVFWYTHHLYLVFIVMLIVHPLSGVLKEEVIRTETSLNISQVTSYSEFVPIKSKGWLWMSVPLTCFLLDLVWRICTRNRAKVEILEVSHMAGHTISLTLSCPHEFQCRIGQYVLLQCLNVSLIEWHPFTVVKVPTSYQTFFVVWIRIKGDWTEALQKLLLERAPHEISMLVDGPFSSPMEGVSRSRVAVCVAAGVGITPFVAALQDMLLYVLTANNSGTAFCKLCLYPETTWIQAVSLNGILTLSGKNPRKRLPGRIHLLWIVRNERELTWLAAMANQSILQLRNANRPDRLHLEFYVTGSNKDTKDSIKDQNPTAHMVVNDKGFSHIISDEERVTLLTPNKKRVPNEGKREESSNYSIAKDYPLIGCRVRRGRPHWDRVFGYWVHLYPEDHLNVYCCGPKKLVKSLRNNCKRASKTSRTKFTIVHEGFS